MIIIGNTDKERQELNHISSLLLKDCSPNITEKSTVQIKDGAVEILITTGAPMPTIPLTGTVKENLQICSHNNDLHIIGEILVNEKEYRKFRLTITKINSSQILTIQQHFNFAK